MMYRQDWCAMSSMYRRHCFSVRAGTYDVIDGMFHQKSLLCEFTENDAEGIGRYIRIIIRTLIPPYTIVCATAFLVTGELQ